MSDVWDMHQVAKAFQEIKGTEDWLTARAAAAGLTCRVYLHGYGDRKSPKVGIKLSRDSASFPRKGGRAVSWANAYGVAEFDQVVAQAVEYLKQRGKKS